MSIELRQISELCQSLKTASSPIDMPILQSTDKAISLMLTGLKNTELNPIQIKALQLLKQQHQISIKLLTHNQKEHIEANEELLNQTVQKREYSAMLLELKRSDTR